MTTRNIQWRRSCWGRARCARAREASRYVGSFIKSKRLQRSVGDGAASGALFVIGGIEGVEPGIGNGAFDEGVHAAAVEIGAVTLDVSLGGEISAERHFFPEAFGLIRKDAGAADFIVDETADGEGVIADHFSGKAEARAVREQTIFGIFLKQFGRDGRRWLIDGRCDDEALHGFDIPLAGEEFGGEPIEQIFIGGRVTLGAEIFGGLHEADAKIHLPKMIDGDAGSERVGGIDNPLGESEAIAGASAGRAGKNDGGVGRNFVDLADGNRHGEGRRCRAVWPCRP